MSEADARKLFETMHEPSTEEATDAPYTEAELEEIRNRVSEDVKPEEALCVDFWGPEHQPKDHQPRPGYLMVRGHAVAGGCIYMLFDPLYIRTKEQRKGWDRWTQMLFSHKRQCKACSTGKAIL